MASIIIAATLGVFAMDDLNNDKIFDDEKLLGYLKGNFISYKINADDLVEMLPVDNGNIPEIVIPKTTEQVILNRLKISGEITAVFASQFQANALEIVRGDLYVANAEIVQAKNLKIVNGNLNASGATKIELNSLIKSKHLSLGRHMAHYEDDTFFCSANMGSVGRVSKFNKNTGLVQLDYFPWLAIETAVEIVESHYLKRGRTSKQYMKFLEKCTEKSLQLENYPNL